MTKGCHGMLRSARADRALVAIATGDPEQPDLKEMIQKLRGSGPKYAVASEEDLMDFLAKLISRVPKKCPECDGSSD